MDKLLYENEVFRIRGAIFEVYKEMGFGFLEPVYQECLAKEFQRMDIPFGAQIPLTLAYKGEPLFKPIVPISSVLIKSLSNSKFAKALRHNTNYRC